MCGRFILTSNIDAIMALIPDLFSEGPLAPRYNVAPSQPIATIVGMQKPTLTFTQWGLVPEWAKDPGMGAKMINARAETVHAKPTFRNAFKRRRCLIPTDGFYEWKKSKGTEPSQPILFCMQNNKPFLLAGLWEEWCDKEGGILATSAIITTNPNKLVATTHHRMPVILKPEHYQAWLYSDERNAMNLLPLLAPYPADQMKSISVSSHANSVRHDDPECIKPLPRQEQGLLFDIS